MGWTLGVLLGLVLLVLAVGYWAAGDPKASRAILEWVGKRQHWVTYRYHGGTLRTGVVLDDVRYEAPKTRVMVDRAVIKLGWRALLSKELHFSRADLQHVQVIAKVPPSDKPFVFFHLKLPVTLRFDEAVVHNLDIVNGLGKRTRLDKIVLRDALWRGDRLSIRDSSVLLPYLAVTGVDAQMTFDGHWPITGTGILAVGALEKLKLVPVAIRVHGPLDRLAVESQARWPDLLTLTGEVQPLEKGVPYRGKLVWQDYRWPVATGQQLFSKSGSADLDGTVEGMALRLNTHLRGKNVPEGQYDLSGHTNWKGFDINRLDAALLKGTARLHGQLGWQQGVHWRLKGQVNNLDVRPLLPAAAAPHVPARISGPVVSVADLSDRRSALGVQLQQTGGMTLLAGLGREGALGNAQLPLGADVRWRNLRQQQAGIGLINSPSGRAQILLHGAKKTAQVQFELREGSRLPAGRYQGRVVNQGKLTQVQHFAYRGKAGALGGSARLTQPARAGQPLLWQADLNTGGLNPQQLVAAAPFEHLSGRVLLQGRLDANRVMVHAPAINLSGRLQAQKGQPARAMRLQGQGNAALLMQPKGGLRSFAAQFNGQFNTAGVPGGTLIADVAGTPQLINIRRLVHDGEAGGINAQGSVGTAGGLHWNIKGQLRNFNPGFFVQGWGGRLTGPVVTRGAWSSRQRNIQIDQMNVQGTLRNQPLLARGRLHLALGQGQGLAVVQNGRWQAQDVLIDWGGNRLTANGTQQAMALRVDASQLSRLHPRLSGNVTGALNISGALQSPDVQVNLDATGLKLGGLQVGRAHVQGLIRRLGDAASQLQIDVENLNTGTQVFRSVQANLSGTRGQHQLDAMVDARQGRIRVHAQGRLDAAYNWLGTVSGGEIITQYATLRQKTPAQVSWNQARRQATVSAHCWDGKGGSLCITEPVIASPKQGTIHLNLRNLDVQAFDAFMPRGVAWSGTLNGQGKLGWQAGRPPSLDAVIYTDNGSIGLESEDPQDPPITLAYQRLSLVARTEAQGIHLRFDAKTPGIGTGYIDTIVNPRTKPMSINGALVLDNVEVGIFKPFFPGMRVLSGTASLAGGMSGPLTAPEFYGNFKLNDGRLALASVPVNLNRINLAAQVRGKQATLAGDFFSGDGKGTLTGQATWAGTPRVALNLKGNELLLRQPPQLTARLNPDISVLLLPASRDVQVRGRVDVPSAVVTPSSRGDRVIPLSADVRVVDRRLLAQQDADAQAAKVKVPWRIDASVDVELGQNVVFRGFGANVPLGGQINVASRGQSPLRARGQIAAQRMVQVDAFGQSLMLRRAEVNFAGSLTQPTLAIEATKAVEGRTVGVRIGGKPTAPGIVIFNDAGLSEQEALNALLTGRLSANNSLTNTAGFRSDVNNTLAAAGLSFGLGGVRNFTNQLGRSVGLSGLTVDAQGVGDDTQVNLTGYITPDLYLRYGMGVFTPVNKLTLRYQINQRLYMEASSALEKAIDLFYNWRF